MSSSMDLQLAKVTFLKVRSRKDRFLAGIKSIFEQRKNKKKGEENRKDVGLDSWDGLPWAEQRQEDSLRIKREWDSVKKEWVLVPFPGLERSVSPCDMMRGVTKESEVTMAGRGGDEQSIQDSFYAAPTSVGSQAETDNAIRSISELADNDVTIPPSMLVASQSNEILSPDQRKDSNATIRPDIVAIDSSAMCVPPGELSRPSLAATQKHICLRRTAIWNAARRKGLEFWKFGGQRSPEAESESNDAEEPLLASPKSKNKALPAKPTESELDGLSKMIENIDAKKVNYVRHIWHEDTHTWTHERTAGTETDKEIQASPQNEVF